MSLTSNLEMDLLTQLNKFVGYGPDPQVAQKRAQLFFLGIEEAAAEGERNLSCRAQDFLSVEDLRDAHQKLGRHGCFNPFDMPAAKNPVRTWNMMSRIILALGNDSDWHRVERWSWYWRERLGRRDGETFLTECFPVPRPGRNHFVPAVPGWNPVQAWPTRRSLLRELIAASQPKYLIAYGSEPGRLCEEIVGPSRLAWLSVLETRNIQVAQAPTGMVIARTGFFGHGRFRVSDVPLLRAAMLRYGRGPLTFGE